LRHTLGSTNPAAARTGLLKKLVGAARAYLDTELDAGEAAQETGRCANSSSPPPLPDGQTRRELKSRPRRRWRKASDAGIILNRWGMLEIPVEQALSKRHK